MSSAIAVIPARYDSVRFPGKPLACETGKPLVQHVVEQAEKATTIERAIVATDDQRIYDAVLAFGGQIAMTSAMHPNGTSRIAEVVEKMQLPAGAIVVNVQGDEPEIDPAIIDAVVEALASNDLADMATVASPFAGDEDPEDPNIVKVVCTTASNGVAHAMYFSRSAIPHVRDGRERPHLKHLGLYAYRARFLLEYVALEPTPLEQLEKLEQLRALEHGKTIAVVIAKTNHHGIDTPEQYAAFVERDKGR